MLVPDVADDLLEQVFKRHDPAEPAELVDDDGQVMPAGPHVLQHACCGLAFGHEDDRAQDGLEVQGSRAAAGESMQEILGVQHADDVVDRLAMHGVARMRCLSDLPQDLVDRDRDLEGVGLRARDHHVSRRDVPEFEHIADDLGLLVIERARHLALVDDELHLGSRDRGRRLGAAPLEALRDERAQPKRRRREGSDQDFDRPEQAKEPRRPAFWCLGGGGLQHLGGDRVDDDGSERSDGWHPAVEPAGQRFSQ